MSWSSPIQLLHAIFYALQLQVTSLIVTLLASTWYSPILAAVYRFSSAHSGPIRFMIDHQYDTKPSLAFELQLMSEAATLRVFTVYSVTASELHKIKSVDTKSQVIEVGCRSLSNRAGQSPADSS